MSTNAFLSVVTVIQGNHSAEAIKLFIEKAGALLSDRFDHYEIILAVNGPNIDFTTMDADPTIRKNCYVLEFAHTVLWDSAVMAGLQRANGDYVVNFDTSLVDQLHLILRMYDIAQSGSDVVYARGDKKWANQSLKRRFFYKMLNMTGRISFDERARPEFLISRRALNWITQNRATSRFINESLFGTGFNVSAIDVSLHALDSRRARHESTELAWSAILRSTNFPLLLGRYALTIITLASAVASLDALLVRFFGFNLLFQEVEYVPGWAFLVLLISCGFVMLSTTAFALLRSMYIVIDELRTEPPYTIKRFGRL